MVFALVHTYQLNLGAFGPNKSAIFMLFRLYQDYYLVVNVHLAAF